MIANLLASVLLWLLSSFGVHATEIQTHVWGTNGPITINNVETYVQAYASVQYQDIDPSGTYDSCAVWFTGVYYDDGTLTLNIERSCQDAAHDYISSYALTVYGWQYVDY